jgi:hypothetical protein
MYNSNPLPPNIPRILKRKPQNLLARLLRNKLDTLHYAGHDNMLDATVLAFGVFTDEDGVDVVVGSLVSRDTATGTDVCEEGEGAAEGEVEGDVAFSNGGCEGTF